MAKLLKKSRKSLQPNVQVQALAGTGKTTTLCWGANGVPAGVTLSEEQEPIIAAMQAEKYRTARFTAFSKAISVELRERLPATFEVATNHSLGLSTIRNSIGKRPQIDANKTWKILEEKFGKISDCERGKKRERIQWYNEAKAIVSICKATLTGATEYASGFTPDLKSISDTCDFYSVDYSPLTLQYACEVLEESAERSDWLDFDDMICHPHYHGFEPEKVDLGAVDECQDMNAAQISLISRSADRGFGIGDKNQSIFGFAGADPASIQKILDMFQASPRNALVLPLNETRRCGKAIVEYCNQYVPEFRAHPNNPDGIVEEIKENDFIGRIREDWNDRKDVMILSRVNAPLTSYALRLLKERIPCYIKGKAFAASITSLIRKLAEPFDRCEVLINAIDDYETTELSKLSATNRPDADQKKLDLQDKVAVVKIFCDGCDKVQCVLDRFDSLFSDENKKNAIALSSAHRSKGLEADNVYIVRPDLLPHPKISDKSEFNRIQERNLAYVAFSRAKLRLTLVQTSKDLEELD